MEVKDAWFPRVNTLSLQILHADHDSSPMQVKDARFPRVNTFIATSKIHMEHKLRMTPDQVSGQAWPYFSFVMLQPSGQKK